MKKDSTIKLLLAIFISLCLVPALSPVRQAYAQEIDACLACHQDRNLTKADAAGKIHSLFVDKELFLKSTHAGFTCVDCHEGVEAKKHPAGGIKDVNCGDCHDEEAKKFKASKHGQLVNDSNPKAGNPNAPNCQDCHSMHAVMKADNPAATINAENLHKTCGACHEEEAKAALVPLVLGFVKGEEPAKSLTLPTFASQIATRVKGHGKDNLAYTYSTKNCANCHIDPINHGPEPLKTAVCFSCHGDQIRQQKPGIIFGKIHKASVVLDPFLSVLLALGYIGAIALLVLYFRPSCCSKKDTGDQPPA
jgi:hypothetical protein